MRGVRAGARALGEDILKREYYSPVPHLEELPGDTFDRADPLHGIDLDLESQIELVEELSPYIEEFRPPERFFENIMYGAVDAELLYAMTRRLGPRRVIELGSGSTSAVIAAACGRSAAAGGPRAEYRLFDPFPAEQVMRGLDGLTELRWQDAGHIELATFEALEADDILVVDTTHTVKVGSEVNYIVLDVLPNLAPGVHVHFHDIFLPHSYPRAYLERHLFFAEQYLLQAFLAFNPRYEVVLAAHALYEQRRQAVEAAVPSAAFGVLADGPSSFWIRSR